MGESPPLTTGINMSESFAELFEESLKSLDMQPGAIITVSYTHLDVYKRQVYR